MKFSHTHFADTLIHKDRPRDGRLTFDHSMVFYRGRWRLVQKEHIARDEYHYYIDVPGAIHGFVITPYPPEKTKELDELYGKQD
jgi:hypothetical protein